VELKLEFRIGAVVGIGTAVGPLVGAVTINAGNVADDIGNNNNDNSNN